MPEELRRVSINDIWKVNHKTLIDAYVRISPNFWMKGVLNRWRPNQQEDAHEFLLE